jgi:F-type H+-transporting ATPase subunit b
MKRSMHTFARPVALAAVSLLSALPAFASEAAEAEPGVFAGDIGNALWTLVIFGLVVFVLGKFAWGPILKGLQSREDFIHKSLADAKADREAAEARLREYTEKLTTARSEAAEIVEEARRDADAVKRKLAEEAKIEGAALIERAKREIALAKDTAIKELYSTAATLATSAASQIVRKELNPKDHERLIQDAIKSLGEHRSSN